MSSVSSRSPSEHRSRRSRSSSRVQQHKLFITNLDGTANGEELQVQLRSLFDRYGKLGSLVVKKSRNGDYHFGFVEYEPGTDADEAVKNLNNYEVKGKPMKVEFQDNSKRRKDPDKGCYNCGKMGHFARECRVKNGQRGYRGRSRSRSRSYDRYRRHRHRNRSRSYDDSPRHKKQRRYRSRSKEERKKKKTKKHKHRHRSSSMSES